MKKIKLKHFLLILVFVVTLLGLSINAKDFTDVPHTKPVWRTLLPGIEFSVVQAPEYCKLGSPEIAIIKVNPEKIRFDTYHYSLGGSGEPKTIDKWQKELNAPVIFNAGLFDENKKHLGVLIHKGKNLGSKIHKSWKGIFVAEPTVLGLPRANIIDLKYTDFSLETNKYLTAVQTMMLFDKRGNKRIRKSDWLANRTILALDHKGKVLVFVTHGAYTLWGFATMAQKSNLGIVKAMSLDGGYASELKIKTSDFSYSIYGQWSTDNRGSLSIPGIKMELPAVITLFPRKE